MNIKRFKEKPIMGILRGSLYEHIEPLFDAVCEAGLETIEITMNSEKACESIKKAVVKFGSKMMIGAGTVINIDLLHKALDSGATFIVIPTVVDDVVEYCVKNNIPVFPGALSPQEIFNAWKKGAAMVKVFPSKFFGPEYFKEIKGPLNDIELLACGGVTVSNIKDFFSNGASAAAIGGSTFKKSFIENRKYNKIAEIIKQYLHQM